MNAPSPATGDDAQLQRFNALARLWWTPDGPLWPLHLMNRFRVQVILDILHREGITDPTQPQPLAGQKVLDIGCGGGILSETLARLGAEVTGIDLAEQNVQIAREHAERAGLRIDYRVQDITTLDGTFDLVFNLEVVEHVADLPAFIRAGYQRLKPGGLTFVSTINRTPLSYLMAIIGAEYLLKLVPKGLHEWRKFVKPAELEQLLADAGVTLIWRSGVRLNPWRKKFSLQSSMAVNYLLAGRKR